MSDSVGEQHATHEIARRYDQNAERYDAATAFNRDAATRLAASLPRREYRSILDVGCGTGFATLAMLERFTPSTVVGVDLSAQMLERFAQKLTDHAADQVTMHVADVLDMPVPEQAFDCVLASMMLHWVADRDGAIARMADAVAPGGVLAVVAPGPGHDREYAELLTTVTPPVPREVVEVFDRAQVFPHTTEAAMREAGLEILDVWVETRSRCVPPERYMERITAVGSHVWTALMGAEAAAAMIDRITNALRRAAGDIGFRYTFTKTYAIGQRPR